jgi:hypothetical protein
MIKIIPPGSQDFGDDPVSLIKVASSGRLAGNDLRDFIKRAGYSLADEFRKVAFAPGEVPVHLIAMGSSDYYGCFAAGTPFALANGCYIPIEAVEVGDMALSAMGNAYAVSHLFRRRVESSLRISTNGLVDTLHCSTDHPFRVARGEKDLDKADYVPHTWIKAEDIREGDYLVWTSPNIEAPIDLTVDTAYQLADWLGDDKKTTYGGKDKWWVYFLNGPTKVLPPWVCGLPFEVRSVLLHRCFQHFSGRSNLTASLALGFQRLCWSTNLAVSCAKTGRGWSVALPVEGQKNKVRPFFSGGRLYLPVTRIEKDGPVNVFNLEVEGDHTYSGPNVDSHNCNRNGDGFDTDTCRKYHDTFVKNARLYLNHCFVAGTGIVMADRQRLAIEEVRAGDTVATLAGPKKVIRTMQTPFKGTALRFRISGIPTPVVVTPEHPLFALVRSQVHCRHRYSRLGPADHGQNCREWLAGLNNITPEYREAGSLCAGDYLLIPRPEHGSVSVKPEFARLVGWVASEGYLGKKGSIQFTFSSKNTADLASVTECLKANGLHVGVTPRAETGCTMLSACSKELAAELSEYIQGVKSTKRLTGKVLTWNEASLRELLTAYIDGDGYVSNARFNKGQLRIRSSSPQMLNMFADILRAINIPATIQYDNPPGPVVCPINGKIYQGSGSGVVAVSSSYSPQITKDARKNTVREVLKRRTAGFVDGMWLARIDAIEEVEIDEPVYNLETEEPHHYVANEVVVHNCNKDPQKSYGVVKLSSYNEPMHRIELVVALNGNEEAARRNGGLVATKTLEKLARGDVGVSMACHVPYDICSVCGNKARSRAEYCKGEDEGGDCPGGGLFNKIATVLDDGTQLFARNTVVDFFDISDVPRPADRIAYTAGILKAASQHKVGGAELAEQMGVAAPLSVVLGYCDPATQESASLLEKLAGVELAVFATPESNLNLAFFEKHASIDIRVPSRNLLASLAAEKIFLPLESYCKIASDINAEPGLLASANALLPGIYNRIIETQPEKVAQDVASLVRSVWPASQKVRDKIASQLAGFSLARNNLQTRMYKAALHGTVPRVRNRVALRLSSAAEKLATDYATHKLAFLQLVKNNRDTDFDLTCELAVRQNCL